MPTRHVARRRPSTVRLIGILGLALSGLAAHAGDNASASAAQLISDLGLHVDGHPVSERAGWKSPRKILVAAALHDKLPQLQQVAPQVTFVEVSADTPPRDIAEADVAIGVCSADIIGKTKKLQWIQWLGAGVERCVQQPIIRERRPLITNLQRAAGASMAEHVMAMMLMLSRHLDAFFIEQQHARWGSASGDMPKLEDLEGKTILIVGLGGIGTEVAKRAHAFGMRVIATRASGRTGPDYVSYVGLPEELLTLSKQADYIVNCAPLTPATERIFDAPFFATMKPTAYFVSVGRGKSTVTADLVAALKERRIAGAALDVTEPEPLPADSPLWSLPNVIITPHVSGDTPVADEVRIAIVRENLRRYVAGEPMLSVVDIERGY
jgi:phosphoglycerate dehydrogenase-like enzyme